MTTSFSGMTEERPLPHHHRHQTLLKAQLHFDVLWQVL
jgi:hypothetical protein